MNYQQQWGTRPIAAAPHRGRVHFITTSPLCFTAQRRLEVQDPLPLQTAGPVCQRTEPGAHCFYTEYACPLTCGLGDMRSVQDPKPRRAREIALAGTPHALLPLRAHILTDATTMPSFLAASSSPTEVRAHARCRRLPGRGCGHPWLWPLPVRRFSGDEATPQRCSEHDGRVGTAPGAPASLPGGGQPEGGAGVLRHRRGQEPGQASMVEDARCWASRREKRVRDPGRAAAAC
jgi:hypothetical protein